VAYVTPAQVAAELGLTPAQASAVDDRLQRSCDTATELIDATLERTVDDPLPDPAPMPVSQAALELAVDCFRSPAAPFGYYSTELAVASIGADRMRRVIGLLAPYKRGVGIG
jgi:hypothetical protein